MTHIVFVLACVVFDPGMGNMDSERLAALAEGLGSDAAEVRAQAAEELCNLGVAAEPLVPQLIRSLSDSDEMVRYYAAATLGKVGAKSAVPPLERMFRDEHEDEPLRSMAATALGRIGQAAEGALTRAMSSPSSFMRGKAADRLGSLGPTGNVVRTLIDSLNDPDPDVRSAASESLELMGKPASPRLMEALGVPDPLIRVNAARALLRIDQANSRAVRTLEDALRDGPPEIRAYAARFMSQAGENAHSAEATLIAALRDPSVEVRYHAAEAIAAIGAKARAAVPELTNLLDDEDDWVRGYAAYALGEIGAASRPSVPKLTRVLKDPDADVVEFAVRALGEIGSDDPRTTIAALREVLNRADVDGDIAETIKVIIERLADRHFGL